MPSIVQRMNRRLGQRPARPDRPSLPLGADLSGFDTAADDVEHASKSVHEVSPFLHRPAPLRPLLTSLHRLALRLQRPVSGGQLRLNEAVAAAVGATSTSLANLNHVQALQRWRLAELEERLEQAERCLAELEASSATRLEVGHLRDELRLIGQRLGPPLDDRWDHYLSDLQRYFRGDREELSRRLDPWLATARTATEATGLPVVDIGCGDGLWLDLLGAAGILASGVECGSALVRKCKGKGLDVFEGRAPEAMRLLANGSVGCLTAFHVLEHLPFRSVVEVADEAMRVLGSGGALIVEVPNLDHPSVGGSSFHLDPTHVTPLPVDLLRYVVEQAGFGSVEVRHLHPDDTGPRDVAIVAWRG